MKKGFTLAEILITLSIIGVIAALTIPGLVQDARDAQLKVAWKKTFAEMSQVGIRLRSEVGGNFSDVFGSDINNDNIMRDYFAKYMNYTKKCDSGRVIADGCWHAYNNFYKLSGQIHPNNWAGYAGLVLNNGTFAMTNLLNPKCSYSVTSRSDVCGYVFIDVNGFSRPNKIGKDVFVIYLTKNGTVLPTGSQGDTWYTSASNNACDPTIADTYGFSCSADYLYK